ncbi:hypothetical protein [Sabulicella glaciei]|uniref:DUF1127 domain-containing protein n=1 Tax=Sabulicella glaciei TaxID=2984948 RepID=A0ABT3NZJ8_9PROT|nr:hypothetical protein [Roseococcus sp. MDT2-1-1]MCW8087589.1 hypothetical protein [Roseococcus sp. MDT2-1-1]
MSYAAPTSAFQIPLAKLTSRQGGRSTGLYLRLIAWLQTFKLLGERDELAHASDRMLSDIGLRPDAHRYADELLMQKDVVRGVLYL